MVPPRAGWFKVHYAHIFDGEKGRIERRYFDGDKWRAGAYPNHREVEAKVFTRAIRKIPGLIGLRRTD